MTQIYGSKACGACKNLKQLLENYGVEFENRDITEDPSARDEIVAQGFMKIPVLKFRDQYIAGFDLDKVKEILGLSR